MSNTAQNLASTRIASLLDENSFVEIGGCVTARNTDFNLKQTATPSIYYLVKGDYFSREPPDKGSEKRNVFS